MRACPSPMTSAVARRGAHPRLRREGDLSVRTRLDALRAEYAFAEIDRNRDFSSSEIAPVGHASTHSSQPSLQGSAAICGRPRKPCGNGLAEIGDELSALRGAHAQRVEHLRDRFRNRTDRSSCCRSGNPRSRSRVRQARGPASSGATGPAPCSGRAPPSLPVSSAWTTSPRQPSTTRRRAAAERALRRRCGRAPSAGTCSVTAPIHASERSISRFADPRARPAIAARLDASARCGCAR